MSLSTPVPQSQAEEAIVRLMKLPWVSFGNVDAGASYQAIDTEKLDTRSFAAFPALIGLYARDKMIMDPSDAVRRMTWMAAQRLNLKDRGKIAAGMAADIVVFKPETVSDRATYEKSGPYFSAIKWVVVNGIVVVEDGKYNGSRPGKIIRGPGYRP